MDAEPKGGSTDALLGRSGVETPLALSTAKPRYYAESWRQFTSFAKGHEMHVFRDDGLYRHLRFMAPGTYMYGFDLVTWPGYLTICGDIGDYTFSRTRDMFEFFSLDNGINPDYWAQKLQGPHRGRDLTRTYSEDVFRLRLHEWARQEAETGGWDFSECEEGWIYPNVLTQALDAELRYMDLYSEESARTALREIERWADVDFGESREWDLRDWDRQFLVCCWAISYGVATYRAATRDPVAA